MTQLLSWINFRSSLKEKEKSFMFKTEKKKKKKKEKKEISNTGSKYIVS